MTLVSIGAIIAIVLLTAAFTFAWLLARAAANADRELQALRESRSLRPAVPEPRTELSGSANADAPTPAGTPVGQG